MAAGIAEDWTLGVFTSTIHRGRVALWSWDPKAKTARFDELGQRFWGDLSSPEHTLQALFDRIEPRDRDDAVRAWLASANSPTPYEFDFRIPQKGSYRWISARGVGGNEGMLNGKVLAVFVDVTPQREAQDALETLVNEMGHRIANLFSVASAMVNLTAREADGIDALAKDLQARFKELRSAFTYAVSRSNHGLEPTPIGGVVRELVSPYSRGGERITVDVPDEILVAGPRITDLALIVHELATNSVKYGALGSEDGTLKVSGRRDGDDVLLVWEEAGGHALRDVPAATGFGSRMVDHTVQATFGGEIDRRVEAGGLVVRLRLDANQLLS